jgi:hypothetical protein
LLTEGASGFGRVIMALEAQPTTIAGYHAEWPENHHK